MRESEPWTRVTKRAMSGMLMIMFTVVSELLRAAEAANFRVLSRVAPGSAWGRSLKPRGESFCIFPLSRSKFEKIAVRIRGGPLMDFFNVWPDF